MECDFCPVRKDWRYKEQQKFFDELDLRLGIVCYRPDYHGKTRDCNTVLFYTKEDSAHNRKVDRQPTHYSRSEAKDRHITDDSVIYRDPFWSFSNTDVNGRYDLGFANFGKLDLRGLNWKERLEGAIRLAFVQKMMRVYIAGSGGYLALREADDYYNDMNRKQIEAMKMIHGTVYLGDVNFFDEDRKRVIAGGSIYTEYTGQMVYNFGCSFCVPTADKELEELIRNWNADERLPKKTADVEAITGRIEKLGGINLIWY